MDQKCTNDTRFYYNKDMDENLEWLTQNTEDPKSNKGNLNFPTHVIVNVIELSVMKVTKKWQPHHFYINPPPPPFSGLSPLSSKKFHTRPCDSIFRRS